MWEGLALNTAHWRALRRLPCTNRTHMHLAQHWKLALGAGNGSRRRMIAGGWLWVCLGVALGAGYCAVLAVVLSPQLAGILKRRSTGSWCLELAMEAGAGFRLWVHVWLGVVPCAGSAQTY